MEDNTTRMIALLRRLKVEMNGAVVGAMEERGIRYPLSYGVSIPTIRDIARECAPSHSLALFLFPQQVRELMLAAIYIDRPEWVTREQMRDWGRSLTNTELAEQTATGLFAGAPEALEQALEWLSQDDPYRLYAALLIVSKHATASLPLETSQAEQFTAAIDRALQELETLPAYLLRAASGALCRCATVSDALLSRIRTLCKGYAASESPALRELAGELSWQLDYLP